MVRWLVLLVAVVAVAKAQRQHLPQQRVDELLRQPDPRTNEINGVFEDEEEPLADLCAKIRCSAGRGCVISEQGKAVCTCVEKCETETDPRRRVCSNHNETWMSDCDLHRQRCLCEEDLPGCQEDKYQHLQIDYFGQCQQLPTCEEEELQDFPRRMREWLFAVMRDMASRNLLARQYKQMEKEAELDQSHKWTNAVVWKWCDLDGYPKDRVVSRHELFPIRAPLLTLEHCVSPFLDSCDPDDDHRVTLKEWAHCLDLNDEHVESMQDLCDDIRDSASIEA